MCLAAKACVIVTGDICLFINLLTVDIVSPGPGETPLQAVIEGPDEVTIVSSRNKSFTCRVNTTAVIRWTLNGGNLPDNVQTSGIGGYKSVLTIISATQRNGGVYTCLVHSQSSVFRSSASVDAIFYGE